MRFQRRGWQTRHSQRAFDLLRLWQRQENDAEEHKLGKVMRSVESCLSAAKLHCSRQELQSLIVSQQALQQSQRSCRKSQCGTAILSTLSILIIEH